MISSSNNDHDDDKLAEIRLKTLKDQREKQKKEALRIQLDSKKHFLISTESMLNAKHSTLNQKERLLQRLETEIRTLEQQEKSAKTEEEKLTTIKGEINQLEREETEKEQVLGALDEELKAVKKKETALEQKMASIKEQIQSVGLKQKKDQGILRLKGMNHNRRIGYEKEQRMRERESVKREIVTLTKGLQQLVNDQAKLEGEVKQLESQLH